MGKIRMKFVVLGLGSMGKRRIRCLQSLGVKEILGFDLAEERAQESREKYGVKTTTLLEDVYNFKANAWIISTPPNKHMEYAVQALGMGVSFFSEAGVPSVLMQDLLTLIKENKDLTAMPSCTMCFFPGPKLIKKLVENGEIGEPLAFNYHSGQYLPDWHPWEDYRKFYVSNRETGAVREIVPFELTWINNIFGVADHVACFNGKLSQLECDIDDIYQIILKYKNLIGHMQVDVISRKPVRRFRIDGALGTIEWNHTLNNVSLYKAIDKKESLYQLDDLKCETGYIYSETPYIDEIEYFVNTINGKNTLFYNFHDEERTHEMLLKIEKSAIESIVL